MAKGIRLVQSRRVVARPSRPPGFDMTYRPTDTAFGPPWTAWLPSLVYLAIALGVVAMVVLGEAGSGGAWLHEFIVERDVHRAVGARTLALVLVLGSAASLLRSSMRGVRLHPDGLEYRDVVTLGWPRVRRFKWAQIDCIILDQRSIALDLWDGSRQYLPAVGDRGALSAALEQVGVARAIPVRGGRGLDDIPDAPADDDEE